MIIYIYIYYYQSTRVCIRNMHTMHSSQRTPTRSSQYACTYSYYQSSTNSYQYVYARSMILLLLILYTHVLRSMQLRTIFFPLHDVLVCILLWTYTLYIYIYIYINVCTSLYQLVCVLSSYRIHTITTSQTCTMQPNFVQEYSMHILIASST